MHWAGSDTAGGTGRRPPGRPQRHAPHGQRFAGYLLLAPFFVLFLAFGLLPLLYTGWVSLRDWHLIDGDGGFAGSFGTGNYAELFGDWRFYNALGNTVSIFLLSTVVQLLAALGLAGLLNRPLRGRTWWRAGVLMPNVVSVVAVALVFGQLFAADFGTVNAVLQAVGLDPVNWQSERWSAHLAVSVMVIWRWTGYNALIYLAAMQAVPRSLHEAAMLDGASSMQRLWKITIPAIRPTIIFTVIVSTIGGMQLLAEPLVFGGGGLTGGSDRQFQTLSLYLYEVGFGRFEFGYASATAWVMFGVIVLAAAANYLVTRRIRSA